jgi:hypothetical protein
MSGPLYLGMAFLLTGSRDISVPAVGDSILTGVGDSPLYALQDMSTVVGGNLWVAEPAILVLAFFAITALACLGCLRWAVRTRHVGIIVLTTVWFALPLVVILWLVTREHDLPIHQAMFQPFFVSELLNDANIVSVGSTFWSLYQFFCSIPVSLLTTLGELEALMGVIFLSVLRTGQALRTRRYRLLGLVIDVDLVLILITFYIVHGWDLFGSIDTVRYLQDYYALDALGLIAHLLPFAAIALPLLALGGSTVSTQQWKVAVLGISLLSVLMAVCAVCFMVGVLIDWQFGGGLSPIPVLWAPTGYVLPSVLLTIPGGAIVATLLLSLLVALGALRSMRAAGTTASSTLRAPA